MKVTFVEVGGYRGRTTDLVLEREPEWKVILIEPNPDLWADLAARYHDNPRVSVVFAALSNYDGDIALYRSDHVDGSSVHPEKGNLVNPRKCIVPCWEASLFILGVIASGPEEPRIIINLNCEGAELEIMEDLLDKKAWRGTKIFFSGHSNVENGIGQRERYKALTEEMAEDGVDWMAGTITTLWARGAEHPGGVRGYLRSKGKEEWATWMSA